MSLIAHRQVKATRTAATCLVCARSITPGSPACSIVVNLAETGGFAYGRQHRACCPQHGATVAA